MNIFKQVRNWNTQRETRHALSGLSVRQLEDIGFARDGSPFEPKRK